jgi:hypothetical protein
MLYVVRCGVLYVVRACPVPRTHAMSQEAQRQTLISLAETGDRRGQGRQRTGSAGYTRHATPHRTPIRIRPQNTSLCAKIAKSIGQSAVVILIAGCAISRSAPKRKSNDSSEFV